MAINDFLKLNDDNLHEVFNRKSYDPTKDRASMVKRLDKAHGQFQSGTPVKGPKLFRIANGVVELTLPFSIGGKNIFHLPTEKFSDAIQHLKEAIGAGEADEHLKAGSAVAAKGPRAKAAAGGGTREWSDERRARFADTIAARNSSK